MTQIFFILILLVNAFAAEEPDSEIIDFVTEVEVSGDKLNIDQSYLIQVNNRAGELFNPIKIFFNKNEQVSDIRVRIESLDGKPLRTLRQSEFKEESAVSSTSFYEDRMVKKIAVTYNRYPYRVRCSYRKTLREFLTLVRWQPYLLDWDTPVRSARLTLTLPGDYRVNIHEQNIDHRQYPGNGGKLTYAWEASDLKAFVPETFTPHYRSLVPYVQVVPVDFHYGVDGEQSSWRSFGNWVYRLNEGRDALPQEEKNRLKQLVREAGSKRDTIRTLYHDLQDHTRYINVSIDIGGLQTYPSSYVCEKGYGDCKALSNCLQSRLKFLGIQSFYTLVNAGENPPPFFEDFPSNQFNHVLLCVPGLLDTLWLECTSNTAPFGYIGSFIQNRPALLVDKDESRLIRIPALRPDQVTKNRIVTLNLIRPGSASEALSLELRGDGFNYLCYVDRMMEERDKSRYIVKYLGIPETDLNDWSIKHSERDSPVIYLQADLSARDRYQILGNTVMVRPRQLRIPEMESPEKRRYPVNVHMPVHIVDRLELAIPVQADLETLPADTAISSELGTYFRKTRVEPGHLLLVREFKLPVMQLPLSEYESCYDFFQSVRTLEEEKIVYTSK